MAQSTWWPEPSIVFYVKIVAMNNLARSDKMVLTSKTVFFNKFIVLPTRTMTPNGSTKHIPLFYALTVS